MHFFSDFEIDIIGAITSQLIAAFDELEPAALSEENLTNVPIEQGVYQLFRNGRLVYLGKAENLRTRLAEHRYQIIERRDIEISNMTFTCLSVHRNWMALVGQSLLISHYKQQPGNLCEWNG